MEERGLFLDFIEVHSRVTAWSASEIIMEGD